MTSQQSTQQQIVSDALSRMAVATSTAELDELLTLALCAQVAVERAAKFLRDRA